MSIIIKRGSVVSHTAAKEWGIGKVTEVNDLRAVIHFNDGLTRKIMSSHFFKLEKADPALYAPADEVRAGESAIGGAAKKTKKVKTAA